MGCVSHFADDEQFCRYMRYLGWRIAVRYYLRHPFEKKEQMIVGGLTASFNATKLIVKLKIK